VYTVWWFLFFGAENFSNISPDGGCSFPSPITANRTIWLDVRIWLVLQWKNCCGEEIAVHKICVVNLILPKVSSQESAVDFQLCLYYLYRTMELNCKKIMYKIRNFEIKRTYLKVVRNESGVTCKGEEARQQHIPQKRNKKQLRNPLRLWKFSNIYLGKALTNQNCTRYDIKSILYSENACSTRVKNMRLPDCYPKT
jgi:hypothetical protein